VVVEYVRSKPREDRGQGWSAWRDRIPREHVGIDGRHAKPFEFSSDDALACGDPASQSDTFHLAPQFCCGSVFGG